MDESEFRKESKRLIKEHAPHIPEDQIDLHQSSALYWGPENFSQVSDWLGTTTKILDEPEKFSNREVFVNFFGLIDDSELAAFIRQKAVGSFAVLGFSEEQARDLVNAQGDDDTKKYFQLIWQAKEHFQQVHNLFSEDEKFLLRFLRHRGSHITLSKFSVRIEGQGENMKFQTTNWERLLKLSEVFTVQTFREVLLKKLVPHRETIASMAGLLTPEAGKRIFPE